MGKHVDDMSPEASPGFLKKTGVRRVNNRPLFIAIAVLMVFVFIIVMVALKRSAEQNKVLESPLMPRHTDSSMMAAEIVAGRSSGIIAPASSLSPVVAAMPEIAMPVAMLDNPNAPPRPPESPIPEVAIDPELARIRLEKIQQFEEAVKAKTGIELPNQLNHAHAGTNKVQGMPDDPSQRYQMRLQQIRQTMAGTDTDGTSSLSSDSQSLLAATRPGDRWALNSTVQAPRTPFELRAGAVIPGVMISGVKSLLPGQIIGQVSQTVYDTATGKYPLIPQGTRVIGVYSSNVIYGQDALLVAWQRLVFPDGKAMDIGSMPGADSAGFSGFRDETNNHYGRIFGSALLMSGVVGGISYSQSANQSAGGVYGPPTAGSVMSAALGQQLGQVTAQMIEKNLNIAPSLTIRPGYPFNIIVVKDMTFTKPYQSFDYQQEGSN